MASFTLADVREHTYKRRDAWWTVFLVDPLASRLVLFTANRTSITPNQITAGAGVLGAGSAVAFALGTWPWLVLGGVLFHLSFVLDCMDGKIARLKGNGSVFGAWVDFVFDRVRFFVCMMALLLGQWVATGQVVFLLLAPVVTFLDLMRYLNASQVAKTRSTMRQKLRAAAAGEDVSEAGPDDPESTEDDGDNAAAGTGRRLTGDTPGGGTHQDAADTGQTGTRGADADQGGGSGWYERLRSTLLRSRVRMHLFSGIEFEMFVCVVAPVTALLAPLLPVTSLVVGVTVLACAGLALFEVLIVYRLWRATRGFVRELRALRS
ncbi:CDP-alcohol phosphatidyltransferase-like enzyme [Haloactinospora alba]|uniref:CDP-alcohol phosphatidyltransferase-like enzyme n=1 Tax=Haloactinospora alba TaxID=405555 RepID=A0A543NLK2_9ACTN|nr:CDP-alcohol phosphatidyltransferase family protein [Haloactinospora alba]TQN32725.1 CDP-alcohol phosphatidyltransferase-like enzyme [Haloactinospora alba]